MKCTMVFLPALRAAGQSGLAGRHMHGSGAGDYDASLSFWSSAYPDRRSIVVGNVQQFRSSTQAPI